MALYICNTDWKLSGKARKIGVLKEAMNSEKAIHSATRLIKE
jgi:hypothetical protein